MTSTTSARAEAPVAAPDELPGSSQMLLDAVMALSADLDLHGVLERIVESATALTGARYGALGVLGPDENLGEFLTTGIPGRVRDLDRRPTPRPRHPGAADHRAATAPARGPDPAPGVVRLPGRTTRR